MELVDGPKCVAVTGATGAIAGLGLDYTCAGGGVLAGAPHWNNRVWTVFYASSFRAKAVKQESIAQACGDAEPVRSAHCGAVVQRSSRADTGPFGPTADARRLAYEVKGDGF